LLEATVANDTATVKLLLAKGANVNVSDIAGSGAASGGQTPLMNAAAEGNTEIIKLLLAKGADVNAVSAEKASEVKNGPIALGFLTALHLASITNADAVRLLLDAGAKVDVRDVRGMTPLMLAVGTDHGDPRIVKMLLEKGANPSLKSKAGESTIDWAKKIGNPEIMRTLGIPTQRADAMAVRAVDDAKLPTPRQAAEKSLALVERMAGTFFVQGGCVSCHAQNLAGMAIGVARANGIPVDEQTAAEQLKTVKLQWASADQILIQGMNVPGAMDTVMYSVLQLATEGAPPDRGIDAMIHNLAWQQRKEGNWHNAGIARPPMEDADFSRTAICIRAFAVYAPPGRKAEFNDRIARAAAWLKAAQPRSTEDRNMQLLGLLWAGTDRRSLEERVKQLAALQRQDGGWAQTPALGSDAYATATTLYALHEAGVAPSDARYRKGVEYLLRTQLADGSWHVASRSPKFQPYFQSGFPHDHDQWISAAATAWSTIALSYAASGKPMTASLR